jgi:uncharacterized protein YndB with AHSA1/START domain
MTPDRIERDVQIAAPIERVWAVLTEPALVGVWFGQGVPIEIDLRVGGTMVLDFGGDKVFPTLIVGVQAPRYFAYRWASPYPGEQATEENSTLVEFTLTPEGDGTRLTLSESGFAALVVPSAEEWHASYQSHSDGWTAKLAELVGTAQE